jgi:hypothetical protein
MNWPSKRPNNLKGETMTTTVEQAIRQADALHATAAAALAAAHAAQTKADAAGQDLASKRDAARLAWARRTHANCQADIADVERTVEQARSAFYRIAGQDITKAMLAYAAWQDASARHYATVTRHESAANTVGSDFVRPFTLTVPPFSVALDGALATRHVNANADALDAWQAELQAVLDGVTT